MATFYNNTESQNLAGIVATLNSSMARADIEFFDAIDEFFYLADRYNFEGVKTMDRFVSDDGTVMILRLNPGDLRKWPGDGWILYEGENLDQAYMSRGTWSTNRISLMMSPKDDPGNYVDPLLSVSVDWNVSVVRGSVKSIDFSAITASSGNFTTEISGDIALQWNTGLARTIGSRVSVTERDVNGENSYETYFIDFDINKTDGTISSFGFYDSSGAYSYVSEAEIDWAALNGLDISTSSGERKVFSSKADWLVSDQDAELSTYIENLRLDGSQDSRAVGNVLSNTLIGNSGNNELVGMRGNDDIYGGDGVDIAVYSNPMNAYTLSIDGDFFIVEDSTWLGDGRDRLVEVERLIFGDGSRLAIDIDGETGAVAKLLGAVFGADAIGNPEYVGIGLDLLDGGMSYTDLAALAVSVTGKSSSADICNLLWENVIGSPPTFADIGPFKAMLDSGQLSIGQLTTLAADTSFNIDNIDLVGLARVGLEYV